MDEGYSSSPSTKGFALPPISPGGGGGKKQSIGRVVAPLSIPHVCTVVSPYVPRAPVMFCFVHSDREKAQEGSDRAKMRMLGARVGKQICWRWDDDVAHEFLNLSGFVFILFIFFFVN